MQNINREVIINRIKSFIWRAGSVAVVAVGTYVLKIGDFWQLDFQLLVNLGGMAVVALVLSEVTKVLNS